MRKVFQLFGVVLVAGALHAQQSPYTGLEERQIKALSPERVAALLAGEGAGYALSAELNGYPGPRHVLDLADSLALSDDQRARVAEIFDRMQSAARQLGRRIVAGEAVLDSAFAGGTIDRSGLERSMAELGRLEGKLRGVHLAAHLEVTGLLTRHQVSEYGRLRGYSGRAAHEHGAAGHHSR